MANHKSAIKRIRQTERKTKVNRLARATLRTQVKKLAKAIEANELDAAKELLSPTASVIDRAVRRGILHRNTAARMKSRLTARLKKAAA